MYLFIYLSIYLFIYLSIYLSLSLSSAISQVHLFIYVFTFLFIPPKKKKCWWKCQTSSLDTPAKSLFEKMTISESLSEQLRDPCHASNERNEDHDHIPAVDVGMGVAFHPPSDQHMATEPQGQGIEAGHGKVLEAPEAANPQHHGEST